jgi:hypothetical protein
MFRLRPSVWMRRARLHRRPLMLCASVPQGSGKLLSSRRTIHTSVSTVVVKNQIPKAKGLGVAENYVMLPDFPGGDSFVAREELLMAWRALCVPHKRMTPIIATNNDTTPGQVKRLHQFFKYQIAEFGRFKNILVVKGSGPSALSVSTTDPAYNDMCDMVHEVQPGCLALLMHPYAPHQVFYEDILRKSMFKPVKYFTQPIFDPYLLPEETRKLLERLMLTREIDLSVGILELSERMYVDQMMSSLDDTRVNLHGRDKYILPPKLPGGLLDLSYKGKLEKWLDTHHHDLPDSLYTRWALGHDPRALLEGFSGTRYDLRSILESAGGASAATAAAGSNSSVSSTSLVKRPPGK